MQNRQAISRLLLANSISGLAQGISMIAIPWHFSVVLGLHREFGIFYGVITLISCFWSVYAGVLIDRYDRKKILVLQSIFGFIVLASNAFLGFWTEIPLWLSAGIVFSVTAFIYNLHYANIYSFAQEITPNEHYNRIISFIEIQGQATTILGGALAAVLMAGTTDGNLNLFGFKFHIGMNLHPFSLYDIFLLNAIAYLLAFSIFRTIHYSPITVRKIELESVWERIKIGWEFLKGRIPLMVFGWLSLAVFVCVLLISFFLMPSYVSLFLKEESHVFATSELYFACGALTSGIVARYLWTNIHEVNRTLIYFIVGALVLLTFILNKNLFVFYVANILFGFSNASIRFCRVSYLWKVIPNQVIGRVSSVLNLSSYVMRSFFGFLFSLYFYQGEIGIQLVMITLFLFVILSAFIILYYRKNLLRLDMKI